VNFYVIILLYYSVILKKGDRITMGNVKRIFVEKKKSFDIDAKNLYRELKYNLN